MTSTKCLTGTDRVAQASKISEKIFINVQGDEPLINPLDVKKIINAKKISNHVICGLLKSLHQKIHIIEIFLKLS